MKRILLAAALLLVAPALRAQELSAALTPTITAFDTTWDQSAKTALGNRLELIAKKWPSEWIASYYVAYSKAQLSYNAKDAATKDALVDAGEEHLANTVKLIGKETDETHVLRAQLYNARMGADPQNRWQKYGKLFDSELEAAKAMNADNPRIYLLRGISKFYTPKMFGGGKKAAKPYFEKVNELFAKNPAPPPATAPGWGQMTAQWFMKQIEGKEEE